MEVAKKKTLGEQKLELDSYVKTESLALQAICLEVKDEELVTAIDSYKKKFKLFKDRRQEFTDKVRDLLITPFITEENKYAPETYEPYKAIVKRELDIRLLAAAKAKEVSALDKEKIAYKEHIANEFTRVYTETKVAIYEEIKKALRLPDVNLETIFIAITTIGKAPKSYNKFPRKIVTDADAMAISKTIPQPDFNKLIEEMKVEATVLMKSETAVVQAKIDEAHGEAEQEKKENAIVASMQQVSAPKVKTKPVYVARKIVFENTKEWAEAIISSFYENDEAWLMLKNKSYDKLTVGQMAEALSKCPSIEVEGVTYEEVAK